MKSFASAFADRLAPPPNPYAHDPVGWVQGRLREQLWSKEREILESVATNRRTIVHSCNSAGKSFTAARAGAWWIDSHPPNTVRLVTTAASWDQVRTVLWQEIRDAFEKGGLIGKVNQTEWWIGDNIVGYGRKPPDTDATGFFGAHRTEGVLVVVDEASGISEEMWEAIQRNSMGDNDRVLAIGNPDYVGSPFHRRCQPDSGWHVIHISAFDTPKLTGEPVPEGSSLVSQAGIDEVIADYGEESPSYLSIVRGLFPKDSEIAVVPMSWVERCRGPEATASIGALRVPIELGVDVAGSDTGDRTVVFERKGGRAGRMWTVRSSDDDAVADLVAQALKESGAGRVKYDSIGIGHMLPTSLRSKFRQVEFVPVDVGMAARDKTRFRNVKAEIWWEVGRHLSKDVAWDLTEVDAETVAELSSVRWWEDAAGRIQIESKGEVRKRIGRSTDRADALLLSFYTPPVGGPVQSQPYRDTRLRGRR